MLLVFSATRHEHYTRWFADASTRVYFYRTSPWHFMTHNHLHTRRNGLGRFFTTGLAIAFGDAFSLIAGAVFVICIARYSGAETLGIFSFVLALAGIAQTICDAGFDITLPRSIGANASFATRELNKAVRMKLILCAIVLPVVTVIALQKNPSFAEFSIIMIVDIVPSTLAYAYVCALRGLHQSAPAARINAGYNGIPYLMAAGIAIWNQSLTLCAILLLLGDTLKLVHLQRLFVRVAPSTSAESSVSEKVSAQQQLQSLWSEQGSVTFINIISSLLVRLPVVMLGWFGTDAFIGYYSAAARFTTAARILPGAFLHSILPHYSQPQADTPRIRSVLFSTTLVALGAGGILAACAPLLVQWTFRFPESVVILQILALSFIVLSIKTVLEGFLLATHHERVVTRILVVAAVLAIGGYRFAASSSPSAVAWCTVAIEFLACSAFLVVLLQWSSARKRERRELLRGESA